MANIGSIDDIQSLFKEAISEFMNNDNTSFDKKDPLIHIFTQNTALKKRLLDYSRRYPAICRQTDADPETGCMEFDIAKGRFSFRLTAPYSEERRRAASEAAKKHSGNLTRTIQKDVV